MITSNQMTLDLLYKLQSDNPNRQDRVPSSVLTPIKLTEDQFNTGTYYIKQNGKYNIATKYDQDADYYLEPIYNIDLNARSIEAPKYLSVNQDHNSETIYFVVDRYFDNVDLSNVYCVIQYQNANPIKEQGGFLYAVPYFDTTTLAAENKMLFQWAIEGPATAFSGTVTFAIKFYEVDSDTVDHTDGTNTSFKYYKYVLNTMPYTSQVLHGLDVQATSENYYFEATEIEKLYQTIEEVRRQNDLYWIVLSDDETVDFNDPDYPTSTINKNDTITDLVTE